MEARISDLGRLHEIIRVFTIVGFEDLFRRMGFEDLAARAARFIGGKDAEGVAHLERPQRVRWALETLGPTFVKLGQILATRPDLFGPEWIAEFEKLQAGAPAVDFKEIRQQVEHDLGAPLEELFDKVDPTPLAAASVAQVHRATLKDGTDVVLKIQRPGIRPRIDADMRLLAHLAALAEKHLPELAPYHPQKVVQQFAKSLGNELNFVTEAQNSEHVAANFEGHSQIVVPKIYWEWTRERINVQEFVHGIPGVDLHALDAAGMDRKRIAQTGANAVLKMIMIDGLFHADPHPGNFFILSGGRIAFVDFGMMGRVSEVRRQQIMKLLRSMLENDVDGLCAILLEWAGREGDDPGELTGAVADFLGEYAGKSIGLTDLSAMVAALLSLVRDNNLSMPPDQAMLLKVFVSLEGAFKKLDPEFDIMAAVQPTLQEVVTDQLSPRALGKRALKIATQYAELFADLPKEVRRGIYSVKTGNLKIRIELSQLEQLHSGVMRGARLLALASLASAVVIGGAIITVLRQRPKE